MGPGGGVDDVERVPLRVEVAVAVQPIPPVVQHARRIAAPGGRAPLFGLGRPLRIGRTKGGGQLRAVGGPAHDADRAIGESGQLLRLADTRVEHPDLRSDPVPPGHECEAPAVGREPRLHVLAAEGHASRRIASRRVGRPDGSHVLVRAGVHVLAHERDPGRIGRDLRIADAHQVKQVFRCDQALASRAGRARTGCRHGGVRFRWRTPHRIASGRGAEPPRSACGIGSGGRSGPAWTTPCGVRSTGVEWYPWWRCRRLASACSSVWRWD